MYFLIEQRILWLVDFFYGQQMDNKLIWLE